MVVIGALVLVGYVSYLLISVFNSQLALRQSSMKAWKLDIAKRATSTGYYFSERKYDAQRLLASREIFAYFANKALGMSEAYGLKANLFLVQDLFKKTLNEKTIHGGYIYKRIALIDSTGKLLADTSQIPSLAKEDQWHNYLKPDAIMPIMMIEEQSLNNHIILTQACFFKNNYAGQLVIWVDAQPLFDYLVDFSNSPSNLDIRIVDEKNRMIKSNSNNTILDFNLDILNSKLSTGDQQVFQIAGQKDASSEVIGIRIPINNTPFDLLALIPSVEIYGQSNPWQLLMTMGSLAIIIFLVGGGLALVKVQNLVLKVRFDEISTQGELLASKNIQLEREIELRKKVEHELLFKQAEIKKQKDQLQKAMDKTYILAYHDALTGLPNRDLLYDRLHQAQTLANRDGSQLALFFLDLDRFKEINDTLGHGSGDLLLKAVADRLKTCVRESDTVARLGGDEFIILLNSIRNAREVEAIAQKVLESLDKRFNIAGQDIFISTSIGVVLYPNDSQDSMTLLKQADMAMYSAKEKGRNNYQFFSRELNESAIKRRELETHLRQAIQDQEFFLVYQPQINVFTGEIIGLETLLRWAHPEKGTIYPSDFIMLAEETGLIFPIGHWVIRTACFQMMNWLAMGLSGFRIAVNISGKQFHQTNFIEMIDNVLEETKLPPYCLELEFTESIIMKNARKNIQKLLELKKRGIKMAIDDFGTGYSSLSYLKNFPIDLVKIDKSFIQDIDFNLNDTAIIKAILAMMHSLGIDVIAEGVETKSQCDSLILHNCIKMQGYYFSRPKPTEEITQLLKRGFSTEYFIPLVHNISKIKHPARQHNRV